MSATTVRQALSTAVATTGLSSSPLVRDSISAPCAEIASGEWDPRFVMGEAKTTRDFIVTIFGGRVAEDTAQDNLDAYCDMTGTTSVIDAIQDETNALNNGTTADYAVVKNVSELLVVPKGANDYLAIRLTVEVCF